MAFTDYDNEERKEQVEKLRKNYKFYQDKLLQVSQRNRSVLLKKIYNKHNFDLVEIENIKEGTIEKILEKLLKNKPSSINILLDSNQDESADSAKGKLRSLSRNLTLIEEETGQQTGFIGFPFLEGHPNPDFYIRGPIVLFPITLEQKRQARNGGWFVNTTDKKPILNGALLAAIKKKGEYKIPDDYETTFDEMIEEIFSLNQENLDQAFFQKINEWIKNIVPIDESKNKTTIDKIEPLTKDDIEQLEKQPFHLVNHKIMGNFPQADNAIFKDYTTLAEMADNLDVGVMGELIDVYDPNEISHEGEHEYEEIPLDEVQDIQFNTVVPSDSSQDQVIIESKNSDLIVVRGPPGTGKSQTIVNLVSDALSNNQTVMVVCQKKVALEVVLHRLANVGLDRYVVFLDKEHDDRLKMYNQLSEIMQKDPLHGDDSLSVFEISSRIDQKVKWLSDLGKALREPYFGGATIQKLYSRADGNYKPILDLSWIGLDAEWKNIDEYFSKIQSFEISYKKFEDENYPWFGRKGFSKINLSDRAKIEKQLSELIETISNCTLVGNENSQKELYKLLDTFLNNPGWLKMNRKRVTPKIKQILKIENIDENFVSSEIAKVKNGIDWWNQYNFIRNLFTESRVKYLDELISDPEKFKQILESMKNSLSEFDQIQEHDNKRENYPQSIQKILFECNKKINKDENWLEKIKQEIYYYWIDQIQQKQPILKGQPFENYKQYKKDLADLLEKKKIAVIKEIQRKIESSVNVRDFLMPKRYRTSEGEIWRTLYKELNKKRRVKPVRKLFEEFNRQLLQIAPCWLASPESISKVFPVQKGLFDLIIVDEASQLPVERALPFLYRAKRVVIAGDEKQLQPFDLFQVKEYDDEDYEEVSDEKSLLDFALTRHKPIQLNWHYRSKYQELIDFSNHAFYEGRLEVAPNVVKKPPLPHVRWVSCNGTWENNQNHVEAQRVIEEIQNIWRRAEKSGNFPSIVVITFNEKQKDLIDNQIEKKKDEDADFLELVTMAQEGKSESEHLRVKNIENVQGDERDITIFSIGYAKDPEGKFYNRFGTLSQKGGENRLNVAITRARQEMVVVCSIEPTEIKPSENPGPKRLKQFLEYAKATGSSNEELVESVLDQLNEEMKRTSIQDDIEFDSIFEEQVHDRLIEKGFQLDKQVGHSGYKIDLAVIHPNDQNQYVLGIECDGATFHSAKSVKERDVARQEFLEHAGWKFERIWSRDWWRNPGGEIERVISKIQELVGSAPVQKIETPPPKQQENPYIEKESQSIEEKYSNMSKEEASEELKKLPGRRLRNEITKEDYLKIRDILEHILYEN